MQVEYDAHFKPCTTGEDMKKKDLVQLANLFPPVPNIGWLHFKPFPFVKRPISESKRIQEPPEKASFSAIFIRAEQLGY
jgi:hypothetical protein